MTDKDGRSPTLPSTASSGLRERLLGEAAELPLGNPETFLRVAALCRDPRADSRDVALEIQRDEGFAASILRLVNSAYFATTNRIGDLPTAVARLGFDVVEGVALSTPGTRLMGDNRDGLLSARRELHRHAVRTGLAARMIAAADADHEQALAAGLVHNIGLAVIALLAPDRFRVLLQVAERGDELREAEEEILGFTHAELGGLLAERWRYPLPLVSAIVAHDDPAPAGLGALVQAADLLTREAGVGVEARREITGDEFSRAGIDVEAARERVAPLFQAQERSESASLRGTGLATVLDGSLQ